MKRVIPYVILLTIVVQSCATYKLQYDNNYKEGASSQSGKKIHTFFLVGDAGNGVFKDSLNNSNALKNNLNNADKNSTLLYLGDNIYPSGMPNNKDITRNEAENKLQEQIDIATSFKGKTIFIPGNHDWYSNGNEGLKRQQEYVESKLGKKSFLPKNGCPIESIDITEDITLIIVDSQWYITNWDNHPTINENCEIKTRNHFLDEFRSEIKKARGKTTIVAIHHPMFTNGPHGGKYSFKSHMSPFPILGSLKNLLRKSTGISNADIQNTHYNELKKILTAAAQQNDNVIFVSGHDHSLQYIIKNDIPQIISGSGSKVEPVKITDGGVYAHAVKGYAILEVFENGASQVKFINATNSKVEFQTTVIKPNQVVSKDIVAQKFQDSIQVSIYTDKETSKSRFYSFLWGNRYRKYYSTPITAKVVTLDTLLGGLTPIRKGGGTQSRTLRLKAKDGKQYVMRAMKKSAVQYIQASMFKNQYVQKQFENTASEDLVKDVFTGAYPYAPFVIGTLSDAIKINKLNSKLFYIPKHEALGQFNAEFGDELYLFEEHPADGNLSLEDENFTGNIYSTYDVFGKIHENENQVVDEKEYIRARLFDMLIGDWDRHQDQWRWLEFNEDNKIIFKPLPRDRDQAFSIMSDGFILSAAVKLIPMAKLLRKYDDDLADVKGFNIEPFPLDKAFVSHLNEQDWKEQVAFIQSNITDEIIDDAFSNVPSELNDQTIVDIKMILKERRSNLQKIADRYFSLLSKYAVVTGTNKKDIFLIRSLDNNDIEVSIQRKKKDNSNEIYFTTIYKANVTNEIWMYGLDDDDSFEMIGKSNKIKIRLIGGQNNDKYIIPNGKNIVVYDYKTKKNDIALAKKATLKLSDSYDINTYDFKKVKTSQNQFIPIIGANPDDGLKIGFNNTFTNYGFERNPFTSQHQLKAAYYFATSGYEVSYRFELANIIGKINFEFNAGIQSPNFTLNFFGYGNEISNFDDDLGLDYNRVKVRSLNFNPQLKWRSRSGVSMALGLNYDNIEVHNTQNRFVENNPELPSYIFDEVQFFGTNYTFNFENYDNKAYPTMGMKTNIQIGHKTNLDDSNRSYNYIIPDVSFNHKIDAQGKWVVATKLKSHINFGNEFEFYQAASIGGTDGLRGFRNQRFTGNQSFYQNTDLRYSFSSMKTKLIPIRVGIYSGFDYGRIWLNEEDSKKWHNSYGGGFFINGAELLSANIGLFNSSDGMRAAFSLGFQF
ncbi:metallophosphoesterase [Flavobacterium sp. UBA7663]|uniref:metallophosphoesterase n=1 Tax=Flavobacterium sp. UBA7663 TaxID=1946557 RepID=UPI0025C67537|nr:metallophosphoesterase [Flavobacterium sp. UBA7663]